MTSSMISAPATTLPERPPLPTRAPDAGGVEVAAEAVPVLARIADVADARDRLAGQLAADLAAAMAADTVTTATRLSTQVWLENVCRLTAAEATRLLATVDVLGHLPATLGGLRDGRLSWAQVQQLCAAARAVTVDQRAALDRIVGEALDEYRHYHPDELVGRVWQLSDAWQPSRLEKAQAAAEDAEFLALHPDLFQGGSMYAHFGPDSFATICEAIDAPVGPPVACDLDDPDEVEQALDELDDRRRTLARQHGRALAGRLVGLCEDALAGHDHDGTAVPARPCAYVVSTLDALLDRDRTPGWLLTTLVGGHLRANSDLVRRMVDHRGADLRTVVLDDCGEVVGVGRRTRVPPRWLREAVWARDLVDTSPGGTTAVRRCDLDHVVAHDDGGRTDVDNLQAIGRSPHGDKTDRRWEVTRARDGTTTWRDTRSGLTVRRPRTWRRLPDDPDPPDR